MSSPREKPWLPYVVLACVSASALVATLVHAILWLNSPLRALPTMSGLWLEEDSVIHSAIVACRLGLVAVPVGIVVTLAYRKRQFTRGTGVALAAACICLTLVVMILLLTGPP